MTPPSPLYMLILMSIPCSFRFFSPQMCSSDKLKQVSIVSRAAVFEPFVDEHVSGIVVERSLD